MSESTLVPFTQDSVIQSGEVEGRVLWSSDTECEVVILKPAGMRGTRKKFPLVSCTLKFTEKQVWAETLNLNVIDPANLSKIFDETKRSKVAPRKKSFRTLQQQLVDAMSAGNFEEQERLFKLIAAENKKGK